MSTLWTPDGERPVRPEREAARPAPPSAPPSGPPAGSGGGGGRGGGGGGEPSEAEVRAQLEQLRQQLLETPAAVVIANHAFGLFELAAMHLSEQPPTLEEARLAIDALAALVEGLTGRLGEHESQLVEGLAQLRLAFVQISAAARAAAEGGAPSPPGEG